jgi:ParB family chromosome partitioning protein
MSNNNNTNGEVRHDFGLSKRSESAEPYKNPFANIFKAANLQKPISITNIDITKLRPFFGHPFRLYEGQRFADMAESIKADGVFIPIIVQPIEYEDGYYEILSGHNRTEAAKAAGLTTIPAIIREHLTRDEARLIVTETNLIQRSFTNLSHSERAEALSMRHEAMKCQGKRTDLINEIETLLKNGENPSRNAAFETSGQMGNKSKTMAKVGEEYGLSKNSVARYLRVAKLIDSLKKRLDDGEYSVRAAVEISYLAEDEQMKLDMALNTSTAKLDMKKAAIIREYSSKNPLSADDINNILSGILKKKRNSSMKIRAFTLKSEIVSQYFTADQSPTEIEAICIKALLYYRAHKSTSEVK